MMSLLKKNQVPIGLFLVCLTIFISALIYNCGYIIKPEQRITQSLLRIFENSTSAQAKFQVTCTLDQEGEQDTEKWIWFIANNLAVKGQLFYDAEQRVVLVEGDAFLAEEKVFPLNFYVPLDNLDETKIDLEHIESELNRLPDIEKKKEIKRIMVHRLELPVYVTAYSMEIETEAFLKAVGWADSSQGVLPKSIVEHSQLNFTFFVDQDCYFRGAVLTVSAEGIELEANLTMDEINTISPSKTISIEGKNNLMEMSQRDWIKQMIESGSKE